MNDARHTDIAIVGGGLAGSTAAAMLARGGIDTVLIDPHSVYPADFRCEKLDRSQIEILDKTGLTGAVRQIATPDREVWVARRGRLLDKKPNGQLGLLYHTLVNTMRAQIPGGVLTVDKVKALETSADRQSITLASGETIAARLIVLANGLNVGLRHTLGITREVISENHSISIGFDIEPTGRTRFPFLALTFFSETPADRIAYFTTFPIGSTMRVNLFVYRDMQDPWLRQLRETPQQTLYATLPGLQKLLGDFKVTDRIQIRPVDLYVSQGHRQPGIVLAGDAFSTSCPAAGTGTNKVFTDVERLCNAHIPRWLASPGMEESKIAEFYDDPVKLACDAHSTAKAFALRSMSLDDTLRWRATRLAKFAVHWGRGMVRPMLDTPASHDITDERTEILNPAASVRARTP